jgi:ABC-2 type transport system permease protein
MTYLWALYAREVMRFRKLWLDTVMSPIVSTVLYLSVFGIVAAGKTIGNLNFLTFIYTGLLAMMLINSSFSNPAFALIISKNVGTIVDLQLVPIQPWRVGLAYALAAFTRGIVTLAVALLATVWFIPGLTIHNPLIFIAALFLTGIEFGMLGVVFGMRAKNFEALTFMTTFIMQPMIFLAGVFYPVSTLPRPWSFISLFNPVHHNINLLRYSTIGFTDVAPWISLVVVISISTALFTLMHFVTKKSIKNV